MMDTETQSQKCVFTWFDPEGYAWYGSSTTKDLPDLTVDDVHELLHRVADEKAFLVMDSEFTPAGFVNLDQQFIKRPPTCFLEESGSSNDSKVHDIMKAEVKTLERLRAHPHPNLVAYHGCVVDRGYVTGVALQRYDSILDRRMRNDWSQLDVECLEKGLNAAVAHLHTLGLAHNDIKPSNIALNKYENPVLIDFGSSAPFGEKLLSGGTRGWIDNDFVLISRPAHDLSAVKKVVAWAKEENANHAAMLEAKAAALKAAAAA